MPKAFAVGAEALHSAEIRNRGTGFPKLETDWCIPPKLRIDKGKPRHPEMTWWTSNITRTSPVRSPSRNCTISLNKLMVGQCNTPVYLLGVIFSFVAVGQNQAGNTTCGQSPRATPNIPCYTVVPGMRSVKRRCVKVSEHRTNCLYQPLN